ncbi:hypothetical protein [Roseicyclus sp.]|uniref:hypothetical protein n=1 Tax=Roseicyclus sp. TaxID=1914329 RepID=UPI003F6B0313
MTRRAKKLAALVEIAAVLSTHALLPVTIAQARLEAQQRKIAARAARRAALSPDGADPFFAGQMCRQAGHLREQQAAAMAELARLHASLDQAKSAAQPALARERVLARLADAAARKG